MQKSRYRLISTYCFSFVLLTISVLIAGTYLYSAAPAFAQNTTSSVTDCSTFGSAGDAGTLADALATSSTINFDCTGTIIVPEILVTSNLTINGQDGVILSADGMNRVLSVAEGAQVEINNLVLADGNGNVDDVAIGNTGEGGNVYNAGLLTINNSTIRDSRFTVSGPGIYNIGQLELDNVTLDRGGGTNNGGIFNAGDVRAQNLTMRNLGSDGGAAAFFNNSTMVIDGCLIENMSSRFGDTASNRGTLVMNDCVMREVQSAIQNFAGGTLSLNRSTIDSTAPQGWAVDNDQESTMSLTDVTISNVTGGGAPIRNEGEAAIQNSTISNNFIPNKSAIINSGTMAIKKKRWHAESMGYDCGRAGWRCGL